MLYEVITGPNKVSALFSQAPERNPGGEFVTSRYYLDAYPDWVTAFNVAKPAQAFANTSWTLAHEQDSYRFGDSDDREWETDVAGFGRVFPHRNNFV